MKKIVFLAVISLCVASVSIVSAASLDGSRLDVYFSDFEADDGGLVGTLDWEWGDYAWVGGSCYGTSHVQPPAPYSGNRMWGTVLNDCYSDLGNNSGYDTCVNGNPADDSILSFDVDLTGYADGTLEFYEWFDLFLNWDWGEIYANGTVVFQHCGGGHVPPSAWQLQTIDLTPFAGGLVTIEFHMMASAVVNYSGWYIDDLRVTTTGSGPSPTPTATITSTPEPTATPSPTATGPTATATPLPPVPATGHAGLMLLLLAMGAILMLISRRS
ncbi:MAG TPA: hypothetical protein PLV45_00875 [bacterium]|nr:hypothetical protein [bacterium]